MGELFLSGLVRQPFLSCGDDLREAHQWPLGEHPATIRIEFLPFREVGSKPFQNLDHGIRLHLDSFLRGTTFDGAFPASIIRSTALVIAARIGSFASRE